MKEIMTTAKELAWKAFQHGVLKNPLDADGTKMRERFENWWSENYGNRDATKFHPEHNVYIEGKRYIQAE